MITSQRAALLAGIGYLIIFITGIFANFFVLENLVVSGDAIQTVQNLSTNSVLFRAGILGFIIMVVCDVLLAWLLYLIFIPVDKNLSLLSAWLRLVNAAIFGIALFNLLSVLHILGYPEILNASEPTELHSQMMLSFNAFNNIWLIGLIFFALHLSVLGHLIYKSEYVPTFIGVLLLIAAIGYMVDSLANFMLSDYADYKDVFQMIVVVPGIIGELSLTFWLLFKGQKTPALEEASR